LPALESTTANSKEIQIFRELLRHFSFTNQLENHFQQSNLYQEPLDNLVEAGETTLISGGKSKKKL
jgi:hypothetical protein